jgi:hypothetical protein
VPLLEPGASLRELAGLSLGAARDPQAVLQVVPAKTACGRRVSDRMLATEVVDLCRPVSLNKVAIVLGYENWQPQW